MTRTFAPPVYRALLGKITGESDKAIKIKVHAPTHIDHDKEFWFPLSQIASVHRTYSAEKGTFDVIMASEWILGTKNVLDAITPGNPGITKEYVAMANKSKQERADNSTLEDEVPLNYDEIAHNNAPDSVDNPDDWWANFGFDEEPKLNG